MHGDYQLDNIKNSIAIVSLIKELNLDNDKINLGIKKTVVNTRFFGRWKIIKSKPLVIFDVAHNIDAIKKILKQLKEEDNPVGAGKPSTANIMPTKRAVCITFGVHACTKALHASKPWPLATLASLSSAFPKHNMITMK